ncbi:hypothetical protein GCM10012278_84470 [Nonomuraea glycinis]|uniref:Uncharacterized protein n=1 Tax=Nonomuraea glycinis TaxID=2047744 RepID=A0A918EAI2_9ACTN|nr:hypothetical protein GCM10012278_84470 [Nonomuraea glycinis]
MRGDCGHARCGPPSVLGLLLCCAGKVTVKEAVSIRRPPEPSVGDSPRTPEPGKERSSPTARSDPVEPSPATSPREAPNPEDAPPADTGPGAPPLGNAIPEDSLTDLGDSGTGDPAAGRSGVAESVLVRSDRGETSPSGFDRGGTGLGRFERGKSCGMVA